MAIHSDKNLYPGINPHLNSFLQQDDLWYGFHQRYVVAIARELDRVLPPDYYATPTISIQQMEDFEDGEPNLFGIVIYPAQTGTTPVTHIELLCPHSTPLRTGYQPYISERDNLLRSGLTLVEIDFLHESRPVIMSLSRYPDGERGAFPYTIVVSDPHPKPEDGHMHIFGFGVLDALLVVSIPLANTDRVVVDFGLIYNRLVESSRLYRMIVDYEQEPVNFDRYVPADQERIRQHMAEIIEKSR